MAIVKALQDSMLAKRNDKTIRGIFFNVFMFV